MHSNWSNGHQLLQFILLVTSSYSFSATERKYNSATTPQTWTVSSLLLDPISAAEKFIGGHIDEHLLVAAKSNIRPKLFVNSSANMSALDLEGLMGEEASDKLRALYGEYFLSVREVL